MILLQYFKKTVYKELEKSTSTIPSCSRHLVNLRLNSWNTKYSQNVRRVCKNILSVKHILLECPVNTVISEKWT